MNKVFLTPCFTCDVANLNKVPHGGWFALVIAGAVFAFSFVWWWGSNTKNNVLIATQVALDDVLHPAALLLHQSLVCRCHAFARFVQLKPE